MCSCSSSLKKGNKESDCDGGFAGNDPDHEQLSCETQISDLVDLRWMGGGR